MSAERIAPVNAARRARTVERLDELAWLIDGGVWPPEACRRLGWTLRSAERTAQRCGHRIRFVLDAETRAERTWEAA